MTTPSTSAPSDGSRTVTLTSASAIPTNGSSSVAEGTLHLRAAGRNIQRVAWDEDVVDNEGCGRKSSKICCIYHKPRKFDESSSEEDSDSDSDSSCGGSNHTHNHGHHHRPREGPNPSAQMRSDQTRQVHQLDKDEDRNAYEIAPASKKGKRKAPPS